MPERTAEFFAALELFRAQAPSKAQDNGSAPPPPSKFAQAASQVAKDIQRVQRSVSRLEQLAAKKSLLNDPAEEIRTLTANVKTAVASLTDQLGALRGFVDRPQGVAPSRHCRAHWSVQVDTFRDALSRCTERFQAALHVRTANLRAAQQRRRRLAHTAGGPAVQLTRPLREPAAPPWGSAAQQGAGPGPGVPQAQTARAAAAGPPRFGAPAQAGGPVWQARPPPPPQPSPSGPTPGPTPGPAAAGGTAPWLAPQGPHGGAGIRHRHVFAPVTAQVQAQAVESEEVARERAGEVSRVESTIVELGKMSRKIASMVAEQGEAVTLIDHNMDGTLDNVSAAQTQLLEYYHYVAGNRRVIVAVLVVVAVIASLLVWAQ